MFYYVIGLGNPEPRYLKTRHNVGWLVVDYLAEQLDFPQFSLSKKFQAQVSSKQHLTFVKPTTYMNKSGLAVQSIMQFYDKNDWRSEEALSRLIVIHDDLDIPLGKFKLQFGSGPKVHNGVNSIRKAVGSDQFYYVRVGVDNRQGDRHIAGHQYVLSSFAEVEILEIRQLLPAIQQALLPKIGF